MENIKKDKEKKPLMLGGVSLGVFLLIMAVVTGVNNYLKSLPPSASEIASTVDEVKSKITIPMKIDSAMTLVDITAEPNAIRFHYTISNEVNTDNLTNSYIKNYLVSNVCKNPDVRNFLDRGIKIEYYSVTEDKLKSFFTTLTKADCLN